MQTPTRTRQSIGAAVRRALLLVGVVIAGVLIVAACGDSEEPHSTQPEDAPTSEPDDGTILQIAPVLTEGDHDFEPGRFGTVYLMPESEIGEVMAAIEQVLEASTDSYNLETAEPWNEAIIEPGVFDVHPDLLTCLRYDILPRIDIELKESDLELLQAVADALRDDPAVFSVETFGADLGYTTVPAQLTAEGIGYDEYVAVTCDRAQVWVLFDPAVDDEARRSLADDILAISVVAAVILEPFEGANGDFFRPDLSGYPEMASCEGPATASLRAVVSESDEASSDAVIAALSGDSRVVGFLGFFVDEELDPIAAWEREIDFELCERMTAYVDLVTEISDAEAAVIVARLLDVPGVADVELNLYDPAAGEECARREGDDAVLEPAPEALGIVGVGGLFGRPTRRPRMIAPVFHEEISIDPCFVPDSSSLTIFRGDPDLASQLVLAEAICDLPGVISISSYDEVALDLDPYSGCQALYLDIRMAGSSSSQQRANVRSFLESSESVVSLDGFEGYGGDFKRPIPRVVVGDVDVFECDPELAWESGAMFSVRLHRVDEATANALADAVVAMAGVAEVTGDAIGVEWPDHDCGPDGIWLWFTPDSTATQRAAVFQVLAAEPDVLAVLLTEETAEDAHVGTPDGVVAVGWSVSVKFDSEDLIEVVGELSEQLRSMPGVAAVESLLDFEEHGDFEDGGDTEDVP